MKPWRDFRRTVKAAKSVSVQDVHCMPADGRHQCSDLCWCEPEVEYVDPDTQITVWVHRECQ